MKYATCNFSIHTGEVYVDDGSLVWHNGTIEEAKSRVERNNGVCALFFPGDVPEYGMPIDPDVDRATFEAQPAVWGVCYYRGWNGYVFE